jgi:glyoxylase-like metal-dependent hydrolase (beta-lactamase superfamily II)
LNDNDQVLYDHLETQAAWLGTATPETTPVDCSIRDGDVLSVGANAFELRHTPGHTQGSVSIWIPNERTVIAGDTLFRDSIGRTDLPGGDGRRILVSIREKLLTLPEDAVVVPGHGPSTSIGRERERNPFLMGL